MLNRKKIAETGSVAPSVTPIARIPANGAEMNQFQAKQVLDRGVYGVITPHVSTVEQAYNAVASCRYAKPKSAALYEPKGVRGDGPATAARYWGLSMPEYYARADVWPLAPQGEMLVGMMCESPEAIENLDDILANVPGIGFMPDRRGRSQPGARLSAPVRASRGGRRDAQDRRDLQQAQGRGRQSAHQCQECRAADRRGLSLPDVGAERSYGVVGQGAKLAGYGGLLMNGAESLVATWSTRAWTSASPIPARRRCISSRRSNNPRMKSVLCLFEGVAPAPPMAGTG
jgi:4-hydroxy-2-oxoheptanedioate aldolase